MIYAIAFNPVVEIVIDTDHLPATGTLPAHSQDVRYGDKGIDLARSLHAMDVPCEVWGFLAGPFGAMVEQSLSVEGVPNRFVLLPEGDTRIDVVLNTGNTRVFEKAPASAEEQPMVEKNTHALRIEGTAPVADKMSQLNLFSLLQSTSANDVLVVSGGVAQNVSPHAYARVVESQKGRGARVVVDAKGELLLNSLQHKPFLVHAEADEVAALVECDPTDRAGIVQGAYLMRELGAANVLVDLGEGEAVFVDQEGTLHDGNCTLAAFLHGFVSAIDVGSSEIDAVRRPFVAE